MGSFCSLGNVVHSLSWDGGGSRDGASTEPVRLTLAAAGAFLMSLPLGVNRLVGGVYCDTAQ